MKTIKYLGNVLLAAALLFSSSALAQEKPDTTKKGDKAMKHSHQAMHKMMHDSSAQHKMQDMKMMKDSSNHQMMDKNMKMDAKEKSSADEKDKIIDLSVIDENKDGKVFQCQMHFDIISDKPGKDNGCGMKLEEVSLEKAKENLLKQGYKIKDFPEQR